MRELEALANFCMYVLIDPFDLSHELVVTSVELFTGF